jgi:adenylate kinase
MRRSRPNILITGTPGTGKSTLSEMLADITSYKHIQVSQLVKHDKGLHDGYDEKFDTYILNDDRLLDAMEPMVADGGSIVDFHSCELFPERWFDLVVVLRTDNSVLYDRLVKRGYSEIKITENIECEIMQVVSEEARESYEEQIVVELSNNDVDEMEDNLDRIHRWIEMWCANHDRNLSTPQT